MVSPDNLAGAQNLFNETQTPTLASPRSHEEVLAEMINESGYDDDETYGQCADNQETQGQDEHDQYNDGQDSKGEGLLIDQEPLEFVEEVEKQVWEQKKRKSVRMGAYTEVEDKLICEAWMAIEQDLKTDTKQK